MKALLLTYYYPPEIGAAALRMRAITEAFVRRGWSVEVITSIPYYPFGHTFPEYRGRLWHRESLFGVRVHRVFTYPTQRLGTRRLASYLSQAMGVAVLGTLLRQKWEVVFVESPPMFIALSGLWLSALTHARLALDVTDL